MNAPRLCEGCSRPLNGFMDSLYTVCLDCTKARHRAVIARKCVCGRKGRDSEVKQTCSRRWISCLRCLSTRRTLPDAVRVRA